MKGALLWGWVLLSLALFGCAALPSSRRPTDSSFRVFPRQDQAIHIVWSEIYHRSDALPRIGWVHVTPTLSCPNGFPTIIKKCAGGITPSPWDCYSIEPEGTAFSATALAHELLHVALLRDGAPLPHHSEFGMPAPAERDGAFYARVDIANAALEAAGL